MTSRHGNGKGSEMGPLEWALILLRWAEVLIDVGESSGEEPISEEALQKQEERKSDLMAQARSLADKLGG